ARAAEAIINVRGFCIVFLVVVRRWVPRTRSRVLLTRIGSAHGGTEQVARKVGESEAEQDHHRQNRQGPVPFAKHDVFTLRQVSEKGKVWICRAFNLEREKTSTLRHARERHGHGVAFRTPRIS
ncbi:MAG: hypothetical protein ACRD1X_22330, partial [Vicinamibacteria bacterium]